MLANQHRLRLKLDDVSAGFGLIKLQHSQVPSADRHETFPRDRYLRQVYNANPKIRGVLPLQISTLGKIWADFAQLPTLIENISRTQNTSSDRERLFGRLYFGP